MLDKLEAVKERYQELTKLLADPEIISQNDKYREYAQEHASLSETVATYDEYKAVAQELESSKQMLYEEEMEPEFRELLNDEISELSDRLKQLEAKLKRLLIPKDPNDEKNVIMEIRAGAGGEEAALFAADLFRMYSRYAERQGWKIDVMDSHYTDIGGCKEIIFSIEGRGAYSRLKYESGVHRVQRVPVTETGGRIHTSTATVAVLPEAEEVDVEINPNDLRIDTFCSSGPGGQSVNTTKSAVRVTHLPTGIVVSCQDEKSQLKNKEKALRVLRSRLLEKMQAEQQAELAAERRSQVGTGERSERIRTYNFPQNRVSDHRINLTVHKLDRILDGELDEVIEALITEDQAKKLAKLEG